MIELEEFRAHLADSDEDAAERARRRLRAAQGPGAPRPPRHPKRGGRMRVGVLGGAVVAVGVLVVVLTVGSGIDEGRIGPAPADARAVLVRAADSAAGARDGGISRLPKPDEFFYLHTRGTYRDGTVSGGKWTTKLNTRTYRRWQALARTGRLAMSREITPLPPDGYWFIGNERFSYRRLAAFSPSPRELYERMLRNVAPGQGSSPQAEVFVQLVDALRDVPLAPRQRAAFLGALAEIPGLRLTGPTKDSRGRRGIGVAYVERSRENERHELILSRDGGLLAVRSTTARGKLLEDMVIVRQAIRTRLPK